MSDQPSGAIVVGIDGTEKDTAAVQWAAADAAARRTPLHLLYAYPWLLSAREYGTPPPPDVLEDAATVLDPLVAAVQERHPDLAVTTEVLMEQPSVALVRASEHAPIVVLGARGLGPIRRRFLGSTSQKVAAHASSTVVVVRTDEPPSSGPVVVGVDPRSAPPQILQFAFEEAAGRGADLVVVHARRGAPPREAPPGDGRAQEAVRRAASADATSLATLVTEWRERFPDIEVEVREVDDHPVDALVDAAAGASLLVVGSRSEHGLARLRLGSVSRGVLYAAPVVAVVRVEGAPA